MKVTHTTCKAFTLAEVLIASTLFILVTSGVLAAHIFGLRMAMISGMRLNACADGRIAIGRLLQDIRGAFSIDIGSGGTASSFTQVAANATQSGNAIKLYTSANTAVYVQYYYSSTNNTLYRIEAGQAATVLANHVTTNSISTIPIFSEVGLNGSNQTNVTGRVPISTIRVFLRFLQSNPQLNSIMGTNGIYDLDTLIAPRTN